MNRDTAALPVSLDRLAAVKRLEAVMRLHERRGDGGAPGFAVAVTQGDDVLLRAGVGFAAIEHRLPIEPGTAFRIASVSKQFTCAAILLLAREGRLDIDVDIRTVLPGVLPGLKSVDKGALSLRRLMHMSSGLRDFLTMLRFGGVELDQRVDGAQIGAMVDAHAALNFAPNTRFLYCNTNYLLLGQAVEKVAQRGLGDFLRRNIFDPLGMSRTRHTPDPDAIEPGLATPYLQPPDERGQWDPRGGRWVRAAQRFPLGGEGGLVSTLDDLLVWSRALRTPPRGLEFLPPALRETLPFAHGAPNVYARGQEVLTYRGLTTIGHGGLWPGFRTEFLLIPERDIAVIVVANDSGLNPHTLARRLVDALLWPELGAPANGGAPPAPGLYLDAADGLAVEIGAPNPLHGHAPTLSLFAGIVPLRAEADGWWEAEAGAVVLKVKQDGDGLGLIDDAGNRVALKRIERGALQPAIAGAWRCEELGCTWTIGRPDKDTAALDVAGPVASRTTGWSVRPLAGDWVEIVAPGKFLPAVFTARRAGDALTVQTARARGVRFARA